MRAFLLVIFIIVFASSCQESVEEKRKLPFYNSADFTPKWDVENEDLLHKIRPFNLVNQNNQPFTEKDLEGKICVADFFFTTCPGICPKMTDSMSKIQEEFRSDEDIMLLSHSVTPERDSVAVLKEYAVKRKVDFKRWKLLTGTREEVYDLGRKFYFVEEDEGLTREDDVFLHTENFILLDKNRHIRGIYNGLDPESMIALVDDIKVLKLEL